MSRLERVTIKGYKSIAAVENLELRGLNVLLGANGAGKSNFIGFFKLLNALSEQRLQLHVARGGGADALLHYGRKTTERIQIELYFGTAGYVFELAPTVDNRLIFSFERFYFDPVSSADPRSASFNTSISSGLGETGALRDSGRFFDELVVPALRSWRVFHFHDTSDSAAFKQLGQINDNLSLRSSAENLAAFLLRLRTEHTAAFESIRDSIRLVMPSFDDFVLRPNPLNTNTIQLEWRERNSDYPFLAHQLSDGTLRFMCLATLLLQPDPPATIVIDEPELGLHPYAITVLASMLRSVSKKQQVVLATQSVPLVEEFEPEDLIVVDRKDNQSTFKRLNVEELRPWLEEYSLGDLWQKNVIGARPAR